MNGDKTCSKINNQRGFTLIELLAVIVVLAVVMLIGVNAVLPQMDRARRNSFSIEVNGLVKSAQQYYIIESIESFALDKGNSCCVDLTTLISEGHSDLKTSDNYGGFVILYSEPTIGNIIYRPYLENSAFHVDDLATSTNNSYDTNDVYSNTDTTHAKLSYNTCAGYNTAHSGSTVALCSSLK